MTLYNIPSATSANTTDVNGAKPAANGLGSLSDAFSNLLAAASAKTGIGSANLFDTKLGDIATMTARPDKPAPRSSDTATSSDTSRTDKRDAHDNRDAAPVRDDHSDNETRAPQKADNTDNDDAPVARDDSRSDDQESHNADDTDEAQVADAGDDTNAQRDDEGVDADTGDTTDMETSTVDIDTEVEAVDITAEATVTDAPVATGVTGTETKAADAAVGATTAEQAKTNFDTAARRGPNERAAQGLATASNNAAAQGRVNDLNAVPPEAVEDAELPSVLQQQQADLAKRISGDRPTSVTVNVQDKTGQAASQTPAILNAAVVAAEVSTQASNAPKTNTPTIAAKQEALALNASATAQASTQPTIGQPLAQPATPAGGNQTASQATTSAPAPAPVGDAANAGSAAQAQNGTLQNAGAKQAAQAQQMRGPVNPQHVLQQVSVNITKAVGQGLDRISIQLRPSELGRVDVQLDLSIAGRVSATIVADRPETLEMLRNDSRTLEKALQDAGLDTNANDLNFSLRGENGNDAEQSAKGGQGGNASGQDTDDLEQQLKALTDANFDTGIIEDDKIDIRA